MNNKDKNKGNIPRNKRLKSVTSDYLKKRKHEPVGEPQKLRKMGMVMQCML